MMRNKEDSKRGVVPHYKYKEFDLRIQAFRYYLGIALRVNVFYYFTSGVVLGFYVNQKDANYLEYFLLLPIFMGAVLGGIFIYAAKLQKGAADIIETIKGELELDIKDIPDIDLLYILLRMFGWIFFVVGAGLIAVPFLKASVLPFVSPLHLTLFAAIALLVLIGAGWWSYSFACRLDAKLKEQRKSAIARASAGGSNFFTRMVFGILIWRFLATLFGRNRNSKEIGNPAEKK